MDCSPPGSSVHGIPQERILEWIAISFSRGSSWPRDGIHVSSVQFSRSVVSNSLRPHGLYSLWNSLWQNTGVGGLSLLQGIFPTQGLNRGILHCRRILYHWATRENNRYISQKLQLWHIKDSAQMIKNLPEMQETQVQSLGWEDPLEKGMATHSSILAWRIPWTEITVHGVTKSWTWLSDFHF